MPRIGMSAAVATPVVRPRDLHDVVAWLDARARDITGRRLGRVRAIVCDAEGTPWWLVVRHRGHDVVAPVAAVHSRRHHEVLLDCAAEALPPCPGEIDERAHATLLERFGLASSPAPAPARGPRDACTPRRLRRLRGDV